MTRQQGRCNESQSGPGVSSPIVAALGSVDCADMGRSGRRGAIARLVSHQVRGALPDQAMDWHGMSDVWLYARGIVIAARPYRSGLAVQSPAILGARMLLRRHCCPDHTCPQRTNQYDRQGTLGSMDSGHRTFFRQLGIRYFLRWLKFASSVLAEIPYTCRNIYLAAVVL